MSKKRPDKTNLIDTYTPPVALLAKLGSIAVHANEYTSTMNHSTVDLQAIKGLLADRLVQAWLAAMDAANLLPIRRDGIRYKDPA